MVASTIASWEKCGFVIHDFDKPSNGWGTFFFSYGVEAGFWGCTMADGCSLASSMVDGFTITVKTEECSSNIETRLICMANRSIVPWRSYGKAIFMRNRTSRLESYQSQVTNPSPYLLLPTGSNFLFEQFLKFKLQAVFILGGSIARDHTFSVTLSHFGCQAA